MGDKITQTAQHAAVLRAKFLKAALESGAPPSLSHADAEPNTTRERFELSCGGHSPEIQRAHLEQLVEGAPEAITLLDANYRVVHINSEFTRMFGYTAAESLGQTIEALIVPPDRRAEADAMEQTLATGQKVNLETKRKRKDGSLVDVSIQGTLVGVGGGQAALYAIYRDISERKRAEALSSALYRIAEKTSSAEDLSGFYAAIHSIVGELMHARNFYIALYDPATQYLSFPYFVDEEDTPPAPRKLARGLTEYVLHTAEPQLVTPEIFDELARKGQVNPIGALSVGWLGAPLKGSNCTLGVVAVQSYKRSEEALRRSEARYRSLVQSAVYGIYRSNLEGKFLDVNPALVSMLGYQSAEQVLALDPRSDVFLNPEEQARVMSECKRAGRLDNFEIKWKRKDLTFITVRLSGRAVTSGDEPGGFLEVIAEDVTEKRVLEDQFRQAQKMEAVGRLAGGVAHDFNNLLLVISGYTEQLDPNSPLHQKAEAIQQAADRATTLTRQLLAFSRKQLLELKVVDLNTIVSDMDRLLSPLIGENIELMTRLAAGVGRTRADAGQIEQVLMNLVVNAKDAISNGGKIIIQTANVHLDDSYRREHTYINPGPYVMLSVSDTGCGMDKETLSRVFEPFFTTKEKGKGTGLGLSTVYGIVKQSGGYVFAQSEVGHGTTFRIYLPRVEEAAQPTDTVTPCSSVMHGNETVLLVEDEESVRQLVRETLESRGYKVIEAENGEEALKISTTYTEPIHLLITDVVMPGISGRELAKQLSETHPQTRVLFLSGYTEDAIVHQGGFEPGTAFLQKPFTLQNLSRKVREVLRSEMT